MRFIVTTPVLDGEKFLDETILSVVTQVGPFSIRYHVQDGGSQDRTLAMLAAWKQRLEGDFPIGCASVGFSFASARDNGLYDAVDRGFRACGPGDVMTWINADDRLVPGAFATVVSMFARYPNIDWVTGRHTMITESGEILYLSPLIPYPRQAVAAGIFDGRSTQAFVQQEGTFWRARLWEKAGGLDPRFRLAGDLDLWRRFARHSDLVSADTMLGCFRVREGQLSKNMAKYYAELDASFSPDEVAARAQAARRYAIGGFDYLALVRRSGGPWTCQRSPLWLYKLERVRLGVMSRLIRGAAWCWRLVRGRRVRSAPDSEAAR